MLVRQLDRVGKHERAESPGREPDEPESEPVSDTGDERASGNHLPPVAGGGDKLPSDQTGETDAYSQAYSAPESSTSPAARMCQPISGSMTTTTMRSRPTWTTNWPLRAGRGWSVSPP